MKTIQFRPPSSPESALVTVTGDILPGHGSLPKVLANPAAILRQIQPDLNRANLRICQFETPLTNADTPIAKSGPNLKCPPEAAGFLSAGHFDVALLANNHIGDHGPLPVLETIDTLHYHHIKTVGAGRNLADAAAILYCQAGPFQLGIVNFAEYEFGVARRDFPGCNPLNLPENLRQIREAKKNADHVLVVMHGGNEYNPFPSPRVSHLCHAFVEAGAGAVVNIHPHCPQGIEYYQNTPIVYSPGNFFFPSRWQPFDRASFWYNGYLPAFRFDRNGVFAIDLTFYFFTDGEDAEIIPYQGEAEEEFAAYLAEISRDLEDAARLEEHFNCWCALRADEMLPIIDRAAGAWQTPDQRMKELLPLRNLFSCDAHCELVTNLLRLLERGELDAWRKRAGELDRFRQVRWADLVGK
ncbi:MAG: CapA family protein [Victivallaceae bacterium]